MATVKPKKHPLYRPKAAFDLLSIPLLGSVLKMRYGRLLLQIPFLVLAVLVTYDGFTGPNAAARNLATVTPWVHYRGLVVVVILLAGNLFCMGCPFTIPRTLAKRIAISGIRFPRVLRNKWLAITGLFIIFFLYEWLDLWASPLLTAWVIVFYFVASFVLEVIFKESAFCKYVCPIGTFNFVYSTASPTQIGVKNPDVCQSCQGHECVNGSYAASSVIRIDRIPFIDADGTLHYKDVTVENNLKGTLGCGTELFPPQMTSNMDCVFCLDCVRACPHDNIALMARQPGRELSKTGAWSKRWDVSLLVIILTFMAIFNAFGMVPPIYSLLAWFADLGFASDFVPLLLLFGAGMIVLPIVLALIAAWLSRTLTNTATKHSLRDTVATFAPAFVPLGFGIWIAHYGFHFLIAPLTIVPVVQEFLGQTGDWARFGTAVDNQWIGIIQAIALLGGFLWSMIVAQRASTHFFGKRQGFIGMVPWALLLLILMVVSYQIFVMPMEMRGTAALFAYILSTVGA
ncbi:MAG: FesM [Anaerolineae bacterium]|nr:FesM [Anaerolineae bacterium]